MSAAHVWRANPHESETVAELLIEFRDHLGRTWPSDNAFHAGVERLMEQRDCDFLLASAADGAPAHAVAQLRVRFEVWRAGFVLRLEDLYVASGARREGLGGALVEAAMARGRERGCNWIELDTHDDNLAAQALYARHGFRVGRTEGRRDIVLGRGLDDA